MRDDSATEKVWARVWGAPLVALVAGLGFALIYAEWIHHAPPSQARAKALAKCHEAYASARSRGDTTRVDLTVAIPGITRSTTRDVTCQELRGDPDW